MDQQPNKKVTNLEKRKPKNPIKFKIELNEEQKNKILNFIISYEVPNSFYFNA